MGLMNTESFVTYIISTLAEPLLSPRAFGAAGDDNWFAKVTPEDLRRERRQVLGTGKEDLLEFAELLDSMAEGRRECVVAFRDALDAQNDLEITEPA